MAVFGEVRLHLLSLHARCDRGLAEVDAKCLRVPKRPNRTRLIRGLTSSRNVREGGWVEFQDYDLVHRCDDGTVTDDQENVKWNKGFLKACDIVHREACPGPKLPQWVRDAGFVNVVHHRFKVPVGPWPKDPQLKEIGTLNLVQLLDGMEAFTLRLFCDVLGWTREECLVMLAQVRSEFKSPDIHARFEL